MNNKKFILVDYDDYIASYNQQNKYAILPSPNGDEIFYTMQNALDDTQQVYRVGIFSPPIFFDDAFKNK